MIGTTPATPLDSGFRRNDELRRRIDEVGVLADGVESRNDQDLRA